MQDPGVYCLLLRLRKSSTIRLRRRRRELHSGYYIYVGSAMRGLETRIRRHLSPTRTLHWHIDHLTRIADIHRVFRFPTRSRSVECRTSCRIARSHPESAIAGFGASDCRCRSHLYYFSTKPDFNPFEFLRPVRMDRVVRTLEHRYRAPWVGRISNPFRSLVACVISLRTKDEITREAAERLFRLAASPKRMASLRASEISKLIYPAGFYREKGRTIKKIAEILLKDHGGRVPESLEALVALPGVGRKTANLVLGRAFGISSICVDTHVHRISNRLGYVATDTPDETELALRRKLPGEYWIKINGLLVRHGQETCHPTSPRCSVCPIEQDCLRDGVGRSR